MTEIITAEEYRRRYATSANAQGRANKNSGSDAKKMIDVILNASGFPFVREHKFALEHNGRKFRFDWCNIQFKVALEYEGIFSDKSGHTTITGFTKDTEKYNLAATLGWTVFRCTNKNYKQVAADAVNHIQKLINTK